MTSQQNTKKCIVFGANGYIGRHLVFSLINKGYCVSAFDRHEQSITSEIQYNSIDLVNINKLNTIDWNVDLVFIFAGVAGTYGGFDNYVKYVSTNEIGLLNILDCIRNSKYRPRVIFPSTRLVYKGSETPLTEDSPKESKTIYAVNKLACEGILYAYQNTFDIPYTIYRICVPYGNSIGTEYSYGTVGAFLKQAINNSAIKLYGDGTLRRTFTHVEDLCLQIISSCCHDKALNKIFNTMGEDYNLKQVASQIADKFKATLEYIDWPENDRRIESGHTVFNAEVICNLFNLKLTYNYSDWVNSLQNNIMVR